jgi:hypothetical protein
MAEWINLYEITFPEVAEAKLPVVCYKGLMWGGPHRKGAQAPHAVEVFKAWQREVQLVAQDKHPAVRYADLPQEVMAYFQATKHLSRPPNGGVPVEIVKPMSYKIKKQKSFSWSWTALNAFETCPYAYAEERVYKTVPYVQSEAALWGDRVHKTAEAYLITPLHERVAQRLTDKIEPELLPIVKPYCDALLKAAQGGTLLVEQNMGLTRDLKPCGVTDWGRIWGRGIVDVVVLKGDTAYLYDWKTGKVKDDMTQLLLFCAYLAIYPREKKTFPAKYFWLKDGVTAGMDKPISREEIVKVWRDILVRVRRMEEAWNNEIFPMRKNGLCQKWCSAVSCPHNGRYVG